MAHEFHLDRGIQFHVVHHLVQPFFHARIEAALEALEVEHLVIHFLCGSPTGVVRAFPAEDVLALGFVQLLAGTFPTILDRIHLHIIDVVIGTEHLRPGFATWTFGLRVRGLLGRRKISEDQVLLVPICFVYTTYALPAEHIVVQLGPQVRNLHFVGEAAFIVLLDLLFAQVCAQLPGRVLAQITKGGVIAHAVQGILLHGFHQLGLEVRTGFLVLVAPHTDTRIVDPAQCGLLTGEVLGRGNIALHGRALTEQVRVLLGGRTPSCCVDDASSTLQLLAFNGFEIPVRDHVAVQVEILSEGDGSANDGKGKEKCSHCSINVEQVTCPFGSRRAELRRPCRSSVHQRERRVSPPFNATASGH